MPPPLSRGTEDLSDTLDVDAVDWDSKSLPRHGQLWCFSMQWIYTHDSREVAGPGSVSAVTSVDLLITIINFKNIRLKLCTSQSCPGTLLGTDLKLAS